MEATLERRYRRLEQQREDFLADLRLLPATVLEFRSAPGSWNILEVLDHLNRTEKAIVAQLAERRGSRQPVPLKNVLRHVMVRAVMRSPLRVRMPKTVIDAVTPRDITNFDRLAASWILQRQLLKTVLASYTCDDLRSAVFRHPVAGWTTAEGALQFIDSHISHHRFQVDRLSRTAPRTPASAASRA